MNPNFALGLKKQNVPWFFIGVAFVYIQPVILWVMMKGHAQLDFLVRYIECTYWAMPISAVFLNFFRATREFSNGIWYGWGVGLLLVVLGAAGYAIASHFY